MKMGKVKRNIFWGVVLLLGAVAILVNRLGYLEGMGIGFVLFDIVLAAILIKGIARRSFGTILFSIAFLVIVNDEMLHLEDITPVPVLLAALLGTIGLNLLFPKFGRRHKGHFVHIGDGQSGMVDEAGRNGGIISYENIFGESVKYVSGEILQVNIQNIFGSTQVYFTEALLQNGSAGANVELVFGSVVLYIPSTWSVILNAENCFASVQESGRHNPDGQNVLQIGGSLVFGSLELVYI